MDELRLTSQIAVAGMKAQSIRLRVVSENVANVDSLSDVPGGEPYRRKLVHFRTLFDREAGVDKVEAKKITEDRSDFGREFQPSHPAADEQGYVLRPNVNPLIELMDMREAQRTYRANLKVMEASREMVSQTVGFLR